MKESAAGFIRALKGNGMGGSRDSEKEVGAVG
jgi:hypothetical protein